MEDEQIQAKQTLLQSEIIEKNYDKTAFINFCLSKKWYRIYHIYSIPLCVKSQEKYILNEVF